MEPHQRVASPNRCVTGRRLRAAKSVQGTGVFPEECSGSHRVEVATTFSEVPFNLASIYLLTSQRSLRYSYVVAKGSAPSKTDVLQGTLDLMVLQTLESMGPLHGYGIARRIEQISESTLKLNEGTVYASLMRLQQRRWISASWGTSENNRRAKFYAITKTGRRQLTAETENWRRIS